MLVDARQTQLHKHSHCKWNEANDAWSMTDNDESHKNNRTANENREEEKVAARIIKYVSTLHLWSCDTHCTARRRRRGRVRGRVNFNINSVSFAPCSFCHSYGRMRFGRWKPSRPEDKRKNNFIYSDVNKQQSIVRSVNDVRETWATHWNASEWRKIIGMRWPLGELRDIGAHSIFNCCKVNKSVDCVYAHSIFDIHHFQRLE